MKKNTPFTPSETPRALPHPPIGQDGVYVIPIGYLKD